MSTSVRAFASERNLDPQTLHFNTLKGLGGTPLFPPPTTEQMPTLHSVQWPSALGPRVLPMNVDSIASTRG
jgi:hypothetical protein